MDQVEREEDAISQDYSAGKISLTEYNKQIRDLHRDVRAAAQESAENAYQAELDRW